MILEIYLIGMLLAYLMVLFRLRKYYKEFGVWNCIFIAFGFAPMSWVWVMIEIVVKIDNLGKKNA